MKAVCLAGAEADREILKAEYKAAKRLGEVRFGTTHLFYRFFIRVRYVSYGEIGRAYLRQESGESGEFLLLENYLMLETRDGALHKLRMEREAYAREALIELQDKHKEIKIGYDRPSQSK